MTASICDEAAGLKMPCCAEYNNAWSGGRGDGGEEGMMRWCGGCIDTEMDSESRAHTPGGGSSARRQDAEGVSAANDTLERLVLP